MNNVSLGYHKKIIVSGVNIDIRKGEIITIVGPNGSGKSTIIRGFSRFIKPLEGVILLEGKDIHRIAPKKAARKIGVLPQVHEINHDFTIEALVGFGRYPHQQFGSRFKKEDYEIIDWAIEKANLTELRRRKLDELSGGEAQRAWIAMALAQKTEVLLLDEPTTYLDIAHQLEIMELLDELNRGLGLTIVMVLHDLNQAIRYSHKVFVIHEGTVNCGGEATCSISEKLLNEVFKINVSVVDNALNGKPFFIPLSKIEG